MWFFFAWASIPVAVVWQALFSATGLLSLYRSIVIEISKDALTETCQADMEAVS